MKYNRLLEIAIVRDFLRPLTYVSGLTQAGCIKLSLMTGFQLQQVH